MKRLLLAVVLPLSFMASDGWARGGGSGDNDCNGRGSCAPSGGGQGGAGGAGGTGIGVGVGVGVGIGQGGNASNRTDVRNRATATGTGGNASATGGNASSTQTVNVSGGGSSSGTLTIRNTPDVNAPAIWSNNPCVVSLSGGVAVAGFGMSLGAGIEDRDCTRRANAQHLTAMGERDAAREVLCESAEVRAAFARIGRPCAADVQQTRVQSVSVQPTAPVVAAMPRPVNRPAYCESLLTRGLITDDCR